MTLGANDITAMIADLAAMGATVAVAFSPAGQPASSVDGLRDRDVIELLGGEGAGIAATDDAVSIQTGALPGMVVGSPITIDGVAYTVHAMQPYGDGAMTRILPRTP
jgi:hypothetical protein